MRERKEKAVRESEEYRRAYFHYIDVLMRDLVKRKVQGKRRRRRERGEEEEEMGVVGEEGREEGREERV